MIDRAPDDDSDFSTGRTIEPEVLWAEKPSAPSRKPEPQGSNPSSDERPGEVGTSTPYFAVAGLVGLLVFVGAWLYALSVWGFLFGIMFGWIPALIAAVVTGLLWPLLLILVCIVIYLASR